MKCPLGAFPGVGWRIGGCFVAEICLELWESSRSSDRGSPQGAPVATGVGCCGIVMLNVENWWKLWKQEHLSNVSPKIRSLNFFFLFGSTAPPWSPLTHPRITRTWWKLRSRGNRRLASPSRSSAPCRRFCWRPSTGPATSAIRCLIDPWVMLVSCWLVMLRIWNTISVYYRVLLY